ncbi:ATP-binding protein [Pseudoalteromonas sp. OOF1S-7]|uniref:ATP-binding protein n=1 Tax=Pseudoalteromonas sp. OOF1S-7 TaxID=2917757 RepID=UPI001EF57B78|nr:ATP-binding protein [Pseudoalteromonas sp. OOF1S-7]MCG7534390.1 ATP-binding protein [Pseudoalteromonas sp. OOF1S-7]
MRHFALSLLLAIVVISIATSWLFDHLYQVFTPIQQLQHTPQTQLAHLARDIHALVAATDSPHSLLNHWPAQSLLQPQIVPAAAFPLPAALQTKLQANEQIQLETDQHRLFLHRLPNTHDLLVIRSDQVAPHSGLAWWLTGLFYAAVMALILIWLLPFLLRLLRLRRAAQQFGAGDLSQRLQVGSVLYLRDLERDFNHMAERIEYLVQDVKLLSGAMSHELRTPLARIRLGMDTLEETTDPDKRRHYEARINRDLDTLSRLIDTLLNYARLDQTIHNRSSQPLDLCQLIKKTCAAFETSSLTIDLILPDTPVQLSGDAFYLSTLLNNLLGNAQKYGRGQVRLELTCQGEHAILAVHDNGMGISPPDALHIFKPFVRATSAINTQRSGFGLGLALAQRIAQWHQGELSVRDSDALSGACFTLQLPLL